MNAIQRSTLVIPALLAGLAIHLLPVPAAWAQLNENKVKREASGLYRGKIQGGRLIDLSNPGNPPFVTPASAGKLRMAVRKGNQKGSVTHPQLAGNQRASVTGKWSKTVVKRNGGQIVIAGKGNALEDNAQFDRWKATTAGFLNKRGSKWKASTKVNGTRDFIGNPSESNDDFTEKLTGLNVTGTR